MDTKLKTAIEKWRKPDGTVFTKELELLYKSLVEALQDMPSAIDEPGWETQEPPEMQQAQAQAQAVSDFLAEESQHMDICVRWHLLRLAIDKGASGSNTGTSNVHLQLAKTIMARDSAGWNLLFYSPTGNKIRSQCKWSSDGKHLEPSKQQLLQKEQQKTDKTGSATKKQGKVVDAPARTSANANTNAKTNASVHFGGKSGKAVEKTLFATAMCDGHPHVGALVAEARELLHRKGSTEDIAVLARRNVKNLHSDLAAHKKALPAFRQVLHEVRDFLRPEDNVLLGRVIDDPLPDLASVILASENHAALLTTRERIVQAINKWMAEARKKVGSVRLASHQTHGQDDDDDNDDYDDDGRDDDDDDDGNDYNDDPFGGDDGNDHENDSLANPQRGGKKSRTDRRRGLARKALTHAPEAVLRSPEVLTALMRYNLLEDADIYHAYTKNVYRLASKTPMPFTFASFLDKVPGILHMAVLFQQQPLVETLLRHEPLLAVTREHVRTTTADGGTIPEKKEKTPPAETATAAVNGANAPRDQEADSGRYPLWFNNEAIRPGSSHATREKDDAKWKQIRSALIYCTMKHAENVQTLLTILRESGEPEREINFDMSRLLIEGTSVADFVTSMPRRGRSHSLIRYEETVRYAEFPVLDLSTHPQTPVAQNRPRSHLEHTHREILDMLKWLHDHDVRRIITLRVPDRMAHPHDELEIASVVRRFRVEELDWRILDLSLNIFRPHGGLGDIPLVCRANNDTDEKTKTDRAKDDKTCLRRLHLYTGGRRSALDHWFSAEGLESMKLDYVLIHVIKELTTKKQSDATVKYIRTKLDELEKRKPEMRTDVLPQFWTAQTETPRLQEIIHHLSPRLAQFIAYYRETADECHVKYKSFRPAKVAIIDNGILSMDPPNASRVADLAGTDAAPDAHSNSSSSSSSSSSERHLYSQDFLTADSLWSRICDGKSFVHEQDRVSPWYLASNPHGTQMANLVCAIDPLCQLFVAKIADGHYGYSAARAAAAVKWAVNKGVDIISMSFTTTENHGPFNEAVRKAMERGILIVCSHHDEGARITTEVFPASLGGTAVDTMLRMASCNMYGKLQHDWDDSTVDEASKKINQYDFCINSQDIAVGAIPFLAASTEHISGSSVATAIAAGVCSLLIACLRTLHVMPLDKPDPDTDRGVNNMRDNVTRALATGNRPTYADIKTYLATMAPSTTNPRLISLDRFARLDELRDVNTASLFTAFLNLGAKFTVR